MSSEISGITVAEAGLNFGSVLKIGGVEIVFSVLSIIPLKSFELQARISIPWATVRLERIMASGPRASLTKPSASRPLIPIKR